MRWQWLLLVGGAFARSWSKYDVASWAEAQFDVATANAFLAQSVDGNLLADLDDASLQEIDSSWGYLKRKRILVAIRMADSKQAPASSSKGSSTGTSGSFAGVAKKASKESPFFTTVFFCAMNGIVSIPVWTFFFQVNPVLICGPIALSYTYGTPFFVLYMLGFGEYMGEPEEQEN